MGGNGCTGNIPGVDDLLLSLHFRIYTWSVGVLSSGNPYHNSPLFLNTGQETEGARRGRWKLAHGGKISIIKVNNLGCLGGPVS